MYFQFRRSIAKVIFFKILLPLPIRVSAIYPAVEGLCFRCNVRVIAGKFGGTKLIAPRGSWLRPTSDRIKEFIFSFLLNRIDIPDSVIDLFAGTGSLGIEAASRGARQVVFVEKSKKSRDVLQKNLSKIGINSKVIGMDVFRFFALAEERHDKFELAFCDPPYGFNKAELLMRKIDEVNLIASGGWLVYEHGKRESVFSVGDLKIIDTRQAGDTAVTFMKNERR